MNAIFLLPVNLYGPRDNFDLNSSHVIPALIRKCVEARDSGAAEITLWGEARPRASFFTSTMPPKPSSWPPRNMTAPTR